MIGNWHACFLASHEFAERSQELWDILPRNEGTCFRNIPVDRSCRSVNVTERWLLGSAHGVSALRRCRPWQSYACCVLNSPLQFLHLKATSLIDDINFFDNLDILPSTTSIKATRDRRYDGFITILVTLVQHHVKHNEGIPPSTQHTACLFSCKMIFQIQNVALLFNVWIYRLAGRHAWRDTPLGSHHCFMASRRGSPKKASQLGFPGLWYADFNFYIFSTAPC